MKRKKCTKCGGNKLLCEFHRHGQSSNGYQSQCRECRSKDSKTRACTEKRRSAQLKCTYGITLEDYDKLFEQQRGVCMICSQPQLNRRLCVDHCHTTGKIRGLLCGSCNLTLGILEKLNFDISGFKKYLKG